jgi:hypothetical protein
MQLRRLRKDFLVASYAEPGLLRPYLNPQGDNRGFDPPSLPLLSPCSSGLLWGVWRALLSLVRT